MSYNNTTETEPWDWNASGIKTDCYSVTQNQFRNYKGGITAQVAIFSPQFLYLLVYFLFKRRFVLLACSAKDIFTCSLALYEKTSVKRLETFSLRLVFQLLQGLQENANQSSSGTHANSAVKHAWALKNCSHHQETAKISHWAIKLRWKFRENTIKKACKKCGATKTTAY